LDEQKRYVGFIGTLFRHQGIDVLIDSAPTVLKHHKDVCFLIVGDGPMKTAWQERVSREGLDNHFIFSGQVPYEEVPIYGNAMDICVAPFLREAGNRSPVKVFDYLACAKPVIMGDVAETSSVFAKSGAEVIIPIENPKALAYTILQLLQDDALRLEMGQRGRIFVEAHFSRKQIAQTVENVMTFLVSPRQK
jgi:glycosyltransferase involved in cell wall biosynthesis